ncbi:HeH/LEM domain-containing protein [Pseudomonas shirazensis]|uniref:HeH/LEM domain-containing protein n=1 Tax=Pseudomonas shirazensis TaxID=2745494 RepID=UPI003D2ACBE0
MPLISVETAFPFAVDGNEVVLVQVGEQEVSERCALVAVEHLGVATYLDDSGPTEDDPLKMKVPELKEWLTAKGIDFDPAALKPALQALVPKND